MIERETPNAASLLKRQIIVCAAFCVLLAVIIGSLYWQSRQREWTLRSVQSKHRLDIAYDLIAREIDRVCADALFLADQPKVKQFSQGNRGHLKDLQEEYQRFLNRKQTYDQIRLLDLHGKEMIRVNYSSARASSVDDAELQDKSDRYYFQESLPLRPNEVFVSEFDLNLEHGEIERPLNPVIRFVTPVVSEIGDTKALLVLNYFGAELLPELDDSTRPGTTMLLRPDGHFIRNPNAEDSWGWLLGHERTFAKRFPSEWSRIDTIDESVLTANGVFAATRIPLGRTARTTSSKQRAGIDIAPSEKHHASDIRDTIIVVSHLAPTRVFAASNELLNRLLILAGCVLAPVAIIARYWSFATLTRQIQSRKIATSESKLRELSGRLLRTQEDERRALSREIHDEFGQQVTAINLDLKLAQRNVANEKVASHLERAINENETLLECLHSFAARVRPAVLDDLGLRDAMESHLSEFQQRTGIPVLADLKFRNQDIPDHIADHCYRLLQESLNNILKHADATKVWVSMSANPDTKTGVSMTIRDDGCGYEGTVNESGHGLIGMRERVDLLNGEFCMTSDRVNGPRIEAVLPIDTDHAEEEPT